MTDLLLDLRRRLGLTCILISHDLALAARIADEIAVMHDGESSSGRRRPNSSCIRSIRGPWNSSPPAWLFSSGRPGMKFTLRRVVRGLLLLTADEIAVMHDGEIVERATAYELICIRSIRGPWNSSHASLALSLRGGTWHEIRPCGAASAAACLARQ